MRTLALGCLTLMWLGVPQLEARTFLTQSQALSITFPGDPRPARESVFLTRTQADDVRKATGAELQSQLVIRYVARKNGQIIGYAYFDTHRVRTLPETIMIVLNASGSVERIEILSFDEPPDYLPKRRWLDQFTGRRLDADLALKRAIRPISGASLSGRAVTDAARRVLGIHKALSTTVPK